MNNQEFLDQLVQVRSLNQALGLERDTLAILDVNGQIVFATDTFNATLNHGLNAQGLKVNDIEGLQIYAQDWLQLVAQCFITHNCLKFMYFGAQNKLAQSKILELRALVNPKTNSVVALSLKLEDYCEYGLIYYGLKSNQVSLTKMSFRRIALQKIQEMLTSFQLTICYLVIHNFSNEKIAEIINILDTQRARKTTRHSINNQIERIREIFAMPSKDALIEYLIFLNLHTLLPASIFKDKLIRLD